MEAEIRKNKNTLYVTGIGVLIFELWSLIRNFLSLLLVSDNWYNDLQKRADSAQFRELYIAIIISVLAVFILFELGTRLKVGFSAIAVSKGKSKKNSYIFWVILIIIFQLLIIMICIYNFMKDSINAEMVVTTIVECTSFYTTVDLFVAALKVNKYNKMQAVSEV